MMAHSAATIVIRNIGYGVHLFQWHGPGDGWVPISDDLIAEHPFIMAAMPWRLEPVSAPCPFRHATLYRRVKAFYG